MATEERGLLARKSQEKPGAHKVPEYRCANNSNSETLPVSGELEVKFRVTVYNCIGDS